MLSLPAQLVPPSPGAEAQQHAVVCTLRRPARHVDRHPRQSRWQHQARAAPLPPSHTAALHSHTGPAGGGSFCTSHSGSGTARQLDPQLRSRATGGRRGLYTAAAPSETTPAAPPGGYLSDIIAFEV